MNNELDSAARRHVVVISGSIRTPSFTRTLAEAAVSAAGRAGTSTDLIDVRDLHLPIADPEFHHRQQEHPLEIVRHLDDRVMAADALMLATPVYHGSYSGVLKNLLDLLRWDAFRAKPVGILVHGGSDRTGSSVCDHLRLVIRTMSGHATQTQVITSKADFVTDDSGGPIGVNTETLQRLDRLAAETLFISNAFATQLKTIGARS